MGLAIKDELLGMSMEGLETYMIELGEPAYRGRQLFKWIYSKETNSFYEMSDIPRELQKKMDASAKISIPRVLKQRVSIDGTRKYLFELADKKRIETVLIPHSRAKDSQYTLCISTQVGCPVGCSFCATGQSGWQRNMEYYEIIGQVLGSSRDLKKKLKNPRDNVISNIVFMGMGEPFLNYDATIKSIHILNHSKGINIGQRHITVSTAGEVKGIHRFSGEMMQVTLAISLHACNDQLRNQLVPLNHKYPLKILIEAVEKYIVRTNRRVTFEYIMLDGVNMSRRDADDMIKIVKPLLANINLIPYNEIINLPYKKPTPQSVHRFYNWLRDEGLNVVIREEKGADILAACGQLRAEYSGLRKSITCD